MRRIQEFDGRCSPEALAESLLTEPGLVLLRSALRGGIYGRYSLVACDPFLSFRAYGSRCELWQDRQAHIQFGNPWHILESLIGRYELLDEVDLPFPLGGCFGYWGYGLKQATEPSLPERAEADLELPDCDVGFYGSLVVFDHELDKIWIVATGLDVEGSSAAGSAREQAELWRRRLHAAVALENGPRPARFPAAAASSFRSNMRRDDFVARIRWAQEYIRTGHIYQVNLAQRFAADLSGTSWELFERLSTISPAPFAAYLDCGEFQIASSSPELFLRLSGDRIVTRPIKGTRPRASDPTEDTQLAYELQTSAKELAELVMITDLLRNDLGKISEFGSVQVPDLARLERFSHVQHLVSTVEARLKPGTTHLAALASCFPGGSITGAPKIRAMQIIDELEPVSRGPYTGCLGYIGFNRESQLSILIRVAVCCQGVAYFHAGAGIVADSIPEAEHAETLAKARGFFEAVSREELTTRPAELPPTERQSRPQNRWPDR